FVFMETSTLAFINQYDVRPNRLFYEYLIYPKEVFTTLIKGDPIGLLILLVEAICLPILFRKVLKKYYSDFFNTGWLTRALAFIVLVPFTILAARGTLSPRPFNISSVSFSTTRLANELALNSTYSMLYSLYREKKEKDPTKFYGKVDINTALDLVRARIAPFNKTFDNKNLPLERLEEPITPVKKPYNVVIFMQESLGAEYVGHLGGLPLTPHLDAISKEGLTFTNMFSTGTRTVRGLEAIVASFLPTPGPSVVKLEKAKTDFFTIAKALKQKGYTTEFIYGGDSNFDEMKSFLIGNGVDHFYDQPTFKNPSFTTEWGVSDEDLVYKANEVFKSHGDKNFFALLLSTSSHHPWEYPDGRITPYEQPKNTFNNAVKYADFAIGELFRLAKKEEYYKNTIFVVIADHSTRVFGDEFVPVRKFHIPAVIVGPNVPKMVYEKPASQVDIAPTVLALSGMEVTQSGLGRNVLRLPESDPGRAVMQYYNNFAYLLGNDVIILKPNEEPSYFTLKDFNLINTKAKFSFLEEARANAILPWYLYDHKKY
ncbi:MAG: LTA synthase family protein, partial [Bdellovibrionales bacterium]|nr:LTA synthase family protein [Bdellovibrionales bacterium]